MTADSWPWPEDTMLERARRIANSLLKLLPDDEKTRVLAEAHAVGETWLGGDLLRWNVNDVVPTAIVADLLHVKPSTIRKWHSDGDLASVRRGRYRVGDVMDCAATKRSRRAAQTAA